MNKSQNIKFVAMRACVSINSRSNNTSESLDTSGYNEALIVFSHGTSGGSDALAGFYLEESDDNATFTTIDEATVGNAACVGIDGTAITTADLTPDDSVVFHVDLIKRKRYIRAYIDNSNNASRCAVWALLGTPSNIGDVTNANMVKSEGSGTERYFNVPGA